MDPRNPPDHTYQVMLFNRYILSEYVKKAPQDKRMLIHQYIAELDGYLTLNAPTHQVQ